MSSTSATRRPPGRPEAELVEDEYPRVKGSMVRNAKGTGGAPIKEVGVGQNSKALSSSLMHMTPAWTEKQTRTHRSVAGLMSHGVLVVFHISFLVEFLSLFL